MVKAVLTEVRALATETWREWSKDGAMQWGAALAYYAALSLAPLLVTILAVLSLVLDPESVRSYMVEYVGEWGGEQGAGTVVEILSNQEGGVSAGITSAVLALIGATAVFGQLQKALNRLWSVRAGGGIRRMLRGRLLGFAIVLCIGALFVAALLFQSVLAAIDLWGPLGRALNLGGSVVLFTLLFAAVYQILPDVDIRWRDVWVGAAVTALLFTVGQLIVGLYLGRSTVGSSYGAAGSLVAVLVWLYYSALVFFFGAEFTQVWARRHGRRMRPTRGAVRLKIQAMEPPEPAGEPPSDDDIRARDGERSNGRGAPDARRTATHPDPEKTRVKRGASYP